MGNGIRVVKRTESILHKFRGVSYFTWSKDSHMYQINEGLLYMLAKIMEKVRLFDPTHYSDVCVVDVDIFLMSSFEVTNHKKIVINQILSGCKGALIC